MQILLTETDLKLIRKFGETLKQERVETSNKLLSLPSDITNQMIDLFRDAAIELEVIDISTSYHLMSLAHRLRPNGRLIKEKLDELELLLELQKKVYVNSVV